MAGKNYEVNLDIEGTLKQIFGRRDAVLNAVAFRTEGLTKERQHTDTGFMSNSTQAIPVNSPAGSPTVQMIAGRNNRALAHIANATPATGEAESAVAVAADYAFWQEIQNPALQPAADQAASELGDIVRGLQL